MAGDLPSDAVLFVAGEPDVGLDDLSTGERSVFRRAAGFVAGGALVATSAEVRGWKAARQGEGSGPPEWHLPPVQNQCAELVRSIAEQLGRTLRVVDVNRPSGYRDLVERWVGPNDLLPLLVRSDGSRLEGEERFVPRQVRRFLQPENRKPRGDR